MDIAQGELWDYYSGGYRILRRLYRGRNIGQQNFPNFGRSVIGALWQTGFPKGFHGEICGNFKALSKTLMPLWDHLTP